MLTTSRSALTAAFTALLFLVVQLGVAQAEATLWRIDPDSSSIQITFTVDEKPRPGEFKSFRGEARFDPTALDNADLRLEIETASIDVDEPFATDFVKSIDWLFVEEHPIAIYDLQRLERIDSDRFRAVGLLTLRGKTHPVEGELSISLGGDRASAVGEAAFDRKDFGVGVGFSTLFVEIGPEISVLFALKAVKVE